MVIKGAPNEDAVLCTGTATFALKHVETTNALLLLPPDEVGAVAVAVVGRESVFMAPSHAILPPSSVSAVSPEAPPLPLRSLQAGDAEFDCAGTPAAPGARGL